jgi:hypothetical protein
MISPPTIAALQCGCCRGISEKRTPPVRSDREAIAAPVRPGSGAGNPGKRFIPSTSLSPVIAPRAAWNAIAAFALGGSTEIQRCAIA